MSCSRSDFRAVERECRRFRGCVASRLARRENVSFHATPADAERAGFRPCKRCRPNEAAFADARIHARLTRDVPARRTGRLEESGPLAVYLASSGSDFMTGQTIFLDGGQTVA